MTVYKIYTDAPRFLTRWLKWTILDCSNEIISSKIWCKFISYAIISQYEWRITQASAIQAKYCNTWAKKIEFTLQWTINKSVKLVLIIFIIIFIFNYYYLEDKYNNNFIICKTVIKIIIFHKYYFLTQLK